MVKWTSGGSGRPFNQSAANGRNEPFASNAAYCMKVSFGAPAKSVGWLARNRASFKKR